jgi:hypothetical protein
MALRRCVSLALESAQNDAIALNAAEHKLLSLSDALKKSNDEVTLWVQRYNERDWGLVEQHSGSSIVVLDEDLRLQIAQESVQVQREIIGALTLKFVLPSQLKVMTGQVQAY